MIALLLDLDGTLVDSDHLHHAAFCDVLVEAGRAPIPMADYKARIMGQPNAEIAGWLFPGDPQGHARVDRKEALFRARLGARVEPVSGVAALLDWAGANGARTAVVTNAPRANALAMLAAAGLDGRLPELVVAEECVRPKPDPAPYVEAMRRLGATPSRSVAFEDSRSGIRAARAAGALTFGMTTGLAAAELLQAGAHHAIPDFTAPALAAALATLKATVA
ncbi:HAD family phosphatase [Amaricoccus sp.]|uniref:HAD family hydrolase n=1 Tax=Amaricoccus sp. TaxID=1872485 RepID=UPI001B70F955|nr:HAD-IA family hydrolase [Amaricoccus sp.]MBP7002275.1 HAD-IA family hydrolase [Amaricoccus sp.]